MTLKELKHMRHILKCPSCKTYTMKDKCKCGNDVLNPKPPRYSPKDSYGKYRRKAKEKEQIAQGIL